jgi:hypothetical protein
MRTQLENPNLTPGPKHPTPFLVFDFERPVLLVLLSKNKTISKYIA